jgi:HK97 gp10 family phage protein
MANGVKIEVQGMDKIIKKFGSIPQNVKKEVDAEMAATANNFVNRAVTAAPVDTGFLRSKITFARLGEMNYEIVSAAKYSAYLEFGTITRVKVPSELTAYAMQFKGKGVKKSGGLYPRPFFFPQLPKARAEFQESLSEIAKRQLSK